MLALQWVEGKLDIFDDACLHAAENHGATARYILHVAFPLPPAPVSVVRTVTTPHLKLVVKSDCTVQVKIGLGRIVALLYRSSTSHRNR